MMPRNPLTDNPNVPVFHWQKFVPSDYKTVNINYDQITANDEYEGSYFFHRIIDKRVAQIGVYKTCIDVRVYYVNPFPYGFYQNIDWNDSTFLELTKNAGRTSVLEVSKVLFELGYEYKSQSGFEMLKTVEKKYEEYVQTCLF